MAVLEDLRTYIASHGSAALPPIENPHVVIVGEFHSPRAPDRRAISVQIVRKLLLDRQYRFFGNESFFNAGAARENTRQYLRHGVLPPPFDPSNVTDRSEAGSRIFTREFQPLLDDLRSNPRYVLPIGSRSRGPVRDARIARHFMEELQDRGGTTDMRGVLLLGASHAAARPYHRGQVSTRMILERNGFQCVSMLILTNYVEHSPDDQVVEIVPQSSTDTPETGRFSDLFTGTIISVPIRADASPFRRARLEKSDSGVSLANQYEFLILART
jgi:hypothetical protein